MQLHKQPTGGAVWRRQANVVEQLSPGCACVSVCVLTGNETQRETCLHHHNNASSELLILHLEQSN